MAAHRYTLRRNNWRKIDHVASPGPAPEVNHGWFRLPGSVRVATFADAGEAEEECRRLEAEARAVINPFRCGSSLSEQTSLDDGRLCDWLLDHGLTPPGEGRDWVRWYDASRAAMDDYQREKVWEALDLVRFHEVVEGPVRPLVFVAVEINWEYVGARGKERFVADDEGGTPLHAFRTRREADRFCEGQWEGGLYGNEPHEMTERRHLSHDPLGLLPPKEVCFDGSGPGYDVADVEALDLKGRGGLLPAAAFEAELFLVCRAACWVEIDGRCFDLYLGDHCAPIAAFADRGRAESHAAELTRQAWRELSPVVLLRHRYYALEEFSSHGESEWVRRLVPLGVEPPAKRKPDANRPWKYDWPAWCAAVAPGLSVGQREALWALCDRAELYRVVGIEPEG